MKNRFNLGWKLIIIYLVLVLIAWAVTFYSSKKCESQILSGQVAICNALPNSPLNVISAIIVTIPFGLLASILPFSESIAIPFIVFNILFNVLILYFIGKIIEDKRNSRVIDKL